MTVAEWVVVRELYDAESAPSALADRLGMTRGAISKLADRLIAKGLIARRANAGDRRFQTLALTRQGRAMAPKLAALADENDEEFFAHLDRETRETISGGDEGYRAPQKDCGPRRSIDRPRTPRGYKRKDWRYGRPCEGCRARNEQGLG